MKSGYTLAEWKAMDKERAVRRSDFRKYRRLEKSLRLEQYWALYKRLRNLVAQELEPVGLEGDAALDRLLEKRLPDIGAELARLFAGDRSVRAYRAAEKEEAHGV